jgi:prolyl 4-hydroxylase
MSYHSINEEYPLIEKVHTFPPIYKISNFLTNEECDILIELARPNLKKSVVVNSKELSESPARTSESHYPGQSQINWLRYKVEKLTKLPMAHQESAQVARYLPGQFYIAHHDAFDIKIEQGRNCIGKLGQRIATVLIYLNDVKSGGGTYFPILKKRFIPEKGTAIVFFPSKSYEGKYILDELALHTAENAIDEKWVSQIWIRENKN